MKKFHFFLIFTLSLTLIASCGFRLRGTSGDMPIHLKQGVAVVDKTKDNWEPILKPRLSAADIPVIDNPKKAPYHLVIRRQKLTQEITGVSSSTTPRLYQLTYTITFNLKKAKGKTLIKPTTVSVTRPLTQNNDRVLGSRNEAEKIKHEMKQDAAGKIMSYLYRQDSELKQK